MRVFFRILRLFYLFIYLFRFYEYRRYKNMDPAASQQFLLHLGLTFLFKILVSSLSNEFSCFVHCLVDSMIHYSFLFPLSSHPFPYWFTCQEATNHSLLAWWTLCINLFIHTHRLSLTHSVYISSHIHLHTLTKFTLSFYIIFILNLSSFNRTNSLLCFLLLPTEYQYY